MDRADGPMATKGGPHSLAPILEHESTFNESTFGEGVFLISSRPMCNPDCNPGFGARLYAEAVPDDVRRAADPVQELRTLASPHVLQAAVRVAPEGHRTECQPSNPRT